MKKHSIYYLLDDNYIENGKAHGKKKDTPPKKNKETHIFISVMNLFIGLVVIIVFAIFGITYIAKPLKELTVEMNRVLSSDKELIFDLRIHTINSNLWTIHVADADISVFAFSQVVPSSAHSNGVDPAEYLGGFYHFDEPLSFKSSFRTKKPVTAISQIRIKSPGADKSGNERWYVTY